MHAKGDENSANPRISRSAPRFLELALSSMIVRIEQDETSRKYQPWKRDAGQASRDDLAGRERLAQTRGHEWRHRKAAARFAELDGEVDALGIGGINFAIHVGEKSYPLRSAGKLVRDVHQHAP